MKTWVLCLGLILAPFLRAQDVVDRLDQALSFATPSGTYAARISGLADLEGYSLQGEAPGLFFDKSDNFLNPRLSLFLDAQAGPDLYFFAQARFDRGFDPGDGTPGSRLDEYAVRLTPGGDSRLNLQIGKFATVVGTWVRRHDSWTNPFITAPLPYEQLTGIWDYEATPSARSLLARSGVTPEPYTGYSDEAKYWSVPVIWGPSYTSGFSVFGQSGHWEYAAEMKNRSLSSRPDDWSVSSYQWQSPSFDARLAWRRDESLQFGVSASTGPYLETDAFPSVPPGINPDRYRQTLLAQDVTYAWHHFEFWAEAFESRFAIPLVGNADLLAYYTEAKFQVTPQFSMALRWNQELYDSIPLDSGASARWGRDVWRIDVGPCFRLTAHCQIKFQYSLQELSGPSGSGQLLASQLTVRF